MQYLANTRFYSNNNYNNLARDNSLVKMDKQGSSSPLYHYLFCVPEHCFCRIFLLYFVVFYLDIQIVYLFSVEYHFHIFISKYLSIWEIRLNVHSCCGVKRSI